MKRVLRLEIIGTLPALEALKSPLDALARACGASVFERPGFFLPWARAAVASGQRPACLALYRGAELAGFVPLFFRRDRKAMLARRGGLPVFGSSPAFDLLLAPGEDEAACGAEITRALEQQRWLDLTLAGLAPGNRLGLLLVRAFRQPEYVVQRRAGGALHMIRGLSGGAALEAQMSGRHRRDWRRRERRMADQCAVTLLKEPLDSAAAIEALRHVVCDSWKNDSRMQRIGLQLYEEQIRGTAEDGTLRFWIASHRGEAVAFSMVLAGPGGTSHGYFTAHNRKGHALGAGSGLLFRCVKESLDAGAGEFDLLSDRQDLGRMANARRQTETVTICRNSPAARLRLAALGRVQLLRQALRTAKPRPRS